MSPDEHRFFAGVILDNGDYLIETPLGQQAFTRAEAAEMFVPPEALRSDAQQVVFEAVPVDELARLQWERDALRAQLSEAVGLLKRPTGVGDAPSWRERRAFIASYEANQREQ